MPSLPWRWEDGFTQAEKIKGGVKMNKTQGKVRKLNKLERGLELIKRHFAEEHNVKAHVNISIFSHWKENKHLQKHDATAIADRAVKILGGNTDEGDNPVCSWIKAEDYPNYELTVFYKGKEAKKKAL